MKKLELHWRIFIGMALGAALGFVFSQNNPDASNINPSLGWLQLSHITWMGELFLKLLQMIVIPIIVCSLINGVGHLPVKSLGKMGIATILVFKVQMLFAAAFGLLWVNWLQPGKYIDLHKIIDSGIHADKVKFITDAKPDLIEVVLSMVPSNFFSALSAGSLLQIIVFAMMLAIALVQVKNGDKVLSLFKVFLDAILKITHWIMQLAPFGVFALITKTVAIGGLSSIAEYSVFMITVVGALMSMLFVVGSIMVHFLTDFSVPEFFSKMREAMLTAFSTSSSAATIPVSLETMEEKFGIPNRVASFVIPLGATMSMNGAAIYESIVTLFIAQAWLPAPLSIGQQVFVVFMVLVSTIGTPGIPHGSLVTLAIVLQAVGLPLEAIGVILSIDRVLDMCRTMVNVSFDNISCLILNRFVKLAPDEIPEEALFEHLDDEHKLALQMAKH